MSQRLRLQGLADICSGKAAKAAKAAKADRQAVKGLSWMEAVGGGGGRARERDKTRRDSDIHVCTYTPHLRHTGFRQEWEGA
jgi:hypothetical protein